MANTSLSNLKFTKGSRDNKVKTLGRGYGSGMGKRSTRGQKGQHARKSGNVRQGFEGGQTPLYRKVPKVGFNNVNFNTKPVVLTLEQVKNLKEVKPKSVYEAGLMTKADFISKRGIKLINSKKGVTAALNVTVKAITKGAEKCIKAAGGKITIVK